MPRLPPLNAVRAFDAAAREGSFVLAGLQLGVSSAAVSQQVRNLEAFFGKQLFVRTGNRIVLTDAGRAIRPEIARALHDLASMAERLLEDTPRRALVVSVSASLAELWLVPKLARLRAEFASLTVDVRVEDDPVALLRRTIDLRISYGDYHYPAAVAVPLVHDAVLPLCTPRFRHAHLEDGRRLEDLPDSLFIHTDWGSNFSSHPTWTDWFAAAGTARRPDRARGHRVGTSSLALAAARLGLGIALGQRALARPELEAGGLVALSPVSVRLGHPYCAVLPGSGRARPELRRLLSLLASDGAQPVSVQPGTPDGAIVTDAP